MTVITPPSPAAAPFAGRGGFASSHREHHQHPAAPPVGPRAAQGSPTLAGSARAGSR